MTRDAHYYEPAQGHGLPHDPFKGIVAPRPIGWISTRARNGRANLAPYSFFNAVCDKPPMIAFSSSGRKDTLHNAEETGEFGWNLATRPLAEAMNTSSAPAPREVNEFELAGLTEETARRIAAPLVAESPVSFECRVADIFHLRDSAGRSVENWLVVGEVIAVHILRALLPGGIYDTAAAQPIMRAGGPVEYYAIAPEDLFKMRRPVWPAAGG
jgi:flavin reductase (DIM6/NTAB) family NADH-FMN oxidoreductase RutF